MTASAKTVTQTTDYSNDLWDKISSAEASRATVSPSTGQSLPTVTGSLSNSSSTSVGSRVPSSTAPIIAPSATTASSSAGRAELVTWWLVGVLGVMVVFA